MSNLLIGLFLGILLGLAIPPFYKWIVKKVTKPTDVVNAVSGFILLSVMTGCGKFHGTNQSVWSEFMWLLPLLPFVGGILLIRAGIKSHRSGWEQQTNRGYIGGKERLPLWKNPLFIGGCILILATAAIIWGVNYEK